MRHIISVTFHNMVDIESSNEDLMFLLNELQLTMTITPLISQLARKRAEVSKFLKNEKYSSLFNVARITIHNELSNIDIQNILQKLISKPEIRETHYIGKECLASDPFLGFKELDPQPTSNGLFRKQNQLFMAPWGVDAMYGWSFPGGTGKSINIFIVEGDYVKESDIEFTTLGSTYEGEEHGTQIMGIIAAKNNDSGCIGIVPDANLFLVGTYSDIFDKAEEGDVVNISINIGDEGDILLPIVADNEYVKLIQMAAELGVTTCYCAGNSRFPYNLDETIVLDRNHSSYIDSKGICVGLANFTPTMDRRYRWFNCGSIVDVFSMQNTFSVRGEFSGTSSTTPVIAGIVAQLQSVMKAHSGSFFSPTEIRDIISSNDTGVAVDVDFESDKAVMPDMRKIYTKLGLVPDVVYPDNYPMVLEGASMMEMLEKLFSDNTHTKLADNITLDNLLDAMIAVNNFLPCGFKKNVVDIFNQAWRLRDTIVSNN